MIFFTVLLINTCKFDIQMEKERKRDYKKDYTEESFREEEAFFAKKTHIINSIKLSLEQNLNKYLQKSLKLYTRKSVSRALRLRQIFFPILIFTKSTKITTVSPSRQLLRHIL